MQEFKIRIKENETKTKPISHSPTPSLTSLPSHPKLLSDLKQKPFNFSLFFLFFLFFFLCCLSWKLILLQPLYLQGHQLGTILTHNTAYIQKDIAITIAMAISPPNHSHNHRIRHLSHGPIYHFRGPILDPSPKILQQEWNLRRRQQRAS